MESAGYFFAADNIVIIHCITNNVDQSEPEDIAKEFMKIAETFMKNQPKITTIITGMFCRLKSMKQTTY